MNGADDAVPETPAGPADGIPEGMAAVEAQLLGPGGFFETTAAEVGGETMTVFAQRLPHLRAALEASVRGP